MAFGGYPALTGDAPTGRGPAPDLAATSPWDRVRRALAVELLGVRHVIPIHYGTWPLLAGTPDQLRSELAARGLSDVEVHAPEPGGSVS
jgi:L-ascorbate metabolism protein UlaG (beta-lactamase superfamily)